MKGNFYECVEYWDERNFVLSNLHFYELLLFLIYLSKYKNPGE
jgi:hypothetical protein